MSARRFAIFFLLCILCICPLTIAASASDDVPCFSVRGDCGDEVAAAKEKLAALGYFKGNMDDCFDEALFSALLRYQKTHGMRQTGILAAGVLSALGIEEETDAVSEADFLLLCDFLSDVCKGKSYITMTYAASAAVNRAKDPRFEDGIAPAIFALRQGAGVPVTSSATATPSFLVCRTAYEAMRCGAAFPGVYFLLPTEKAGGLFAGPSPVFSFEGLNFYGDQ